MINLLLNILEGTPGITAEEAQSAVQKVMDFIKSILEMPVVTIGGVTLTVGLIAFAVLKFLLPNNKIVVNQEDTIAQLESENAALKEQNAAVEARIATLEAKMDVVTANTPNKRVRDANAIKVEPKEIVVVHANHTNRKKKVKVKVKKAIEQAIADTTGIEAIANGN